MPVPTDGGNPVVIDAQELRGLATAARSARSDVDHALSRVAGIMGPLDRRGWNAGSADSVWWGTRAGLQRLDADLAQHAASLDERASLVDRFETRAGSVLDLVEPDGADRLGQPTSTGSALPAADANLTLQVNPPGAAEPPPQPTEGAGGKVAAVFYIFIGGRGEDEHGVSAHWGKYIRSIDPGGDSADLTQLSGSNWHVYQWNNGGNPGGGNNTFTSPAQEAENLRANIESITDSGRNNNQVALIGDSKGGALVMEYLAEIAENSTAHPAQHVTGAAAIDAPLAGDLWTNGVGFQRFELIKVTDEHSVGGVPLPATSHDEKRDRLANLKERLATAGMADLHLATVDQPNDAISSSQVDGVAHVLSVDVGPFGHGAAREDPAVIPWVLSEVQTGQSPPGPAGTGP